MADPIPLADRIKEFVLLIRNAENGTFVRAVPIGEARTSREARDVLGDRLADTAMMLLNIEVATFTVTLAYLSPAEVRKLGDD